MLDVARPFDDFDAKINTPDLPQEWYEAIIYNLAVRLSTEYGVDDPTIDRLERYAASSLGTVLDFDTEPGSLYFSPAGAFETS